MENPVASRPRIVVATPLYPPEVGGPATYARALADELPKRGIDVTLVKFSEVRTMPKIFRHLAYAWKVFRAAKGAALVFALDPVSVGLPAVFGAKLRLVPFVVKVVGDYAWEQGVQRSGLTQTLDEYLEMITMTLPQRVRWHRYIEESVVHAAALILVPSAYLSRVVMAWGADPRRIRVVYNAFDPPDTSGSESAAEKHSGLEGPTIISAGRLVPWKGFAELIGVLPEIIAKFPSVRLAIAGDGPERAKIEAAITEHHLEKHVTLLGAIPRRQLLDQIRTAECFVLNTRYEGLSHQLLEVMAIGTPIVTTRTGGNPELIEDGKDGKLVAPGASRELADAILWVLRHPKDARAMAEHAKERSGSFTLPRMIDGTLNALAEAAPALKQENLRRV